MAARMQARTNRAHVAPGAARAVRRAAQAPRAARVAPRAGMNIVFVSAEVAPWSKTGGLGDVLSGLPAALAARGHRVMTVAPRYDQYRDAWDTNTEWTAKMGDGEVTGRYFHTHKRGVDRVFIDHPCFLAKVWGKTGSKIYGNKTGVDYPDNQLRFSAFCQAALQAPLLLDLKNNPKFSGTYGEDVIFVANDWHTALVPAYLKSMYQSAGIFSSARVAYCVHNIAYQGRFPAEDFNLLNVPNQFKSAFTFTTAAAKTPGPKINWMKTGFMLSDKNFTVSPNYAKEITSGPSLGVELDSVIKQSGGIKGIINGMDVVEWNPATDKYLDTPYDESCPEVKMEIKAQLQAEVGLPVNPDVPLMVFVGRLEEQKGSDILIQSLPQILQNNCQLLVLGTGKKKYEKQLEQLEEMYPNKARGIVKFNVPLAHAMTAGADFFVVPSRFEPCGLIQLHAMRYGTVPIVASTGGLVDTVVEGVTGFHMGAMDTECEKVSPADTQACASTIKRALDVYATQPSTYKQMVHACMGQDLSWTGPSKEWERELLSMKAGGSWAAPGEDKIECVVEAKKPHNVAKPF